MWVCVLINLNITIHDATTTPSIDHLIDLGRKGECNCGKFCTGTWASYGNSSDKETMTADRVKGETFLKAPTVAMRPSSQPRQRGTAMVDDDCRGQGEAASQPATQNNIDRDLYLWASCVTDCETQKCTLVASRVTFFFRWTIVEVVAGALWQVFHMHIPINCLLAACFTFI